MPIAKLQKYGSWLKNGSLTQAFILPLDPGWVGDEISFRIKLAKEPEELEDIDFYCSGGHSDLYTFIRNITGDLYFMGNSFLNASDDKEQIQNITRDIIEKSRELEKDIDIGELLKDYDSPLHLTVGTIDKEGFGTSILEPASEQIEGFFGLCADYLRGGSSPSILEMYKWDEGVAKAIGIALGFSITEKGRIIPPADFFDRFLSEAEQAFNNYFLSWLNTKLTTDIKRPLVRIIE